MIFVSPSSTRTISPVSCGWGFAAFPSYAPEYGDRELVTWNLAKGTKQLHLLPETYDLLVMLGISRTHLWVGAAKFGTAGARYLIRIKVQ